VRTAPHNQAIAVSGADLNDPAPGDEWRAHSEAARERSGRRRVLRWTRLLAGRIALVTGGTRGLGAAIARTFAGEGARGAVVDLESGPAPEDWVSLRADVTAEEDVEQAVAATVERFGSLDVVVANAGVVPPWSDASDFDLAALDRTLAVNVRGVAATIKHGARAMRESGGSIVVMASMNAWHAAPAQGAYTASKHAVLGLVRTAALDLGGHGIRVNAIGPGPVATEALRERLSRREAEGGLTAAEALRQAAAGTALGRMVTEDDVARAAVFLASDLASGVTGALVPVDAGLR
jgi:NAD(P)-dependent dehydrogenase (short-subunit alcohol dehydrogenase family)